MKGNGLLQLPQFVCTREMMRFVRGIACLGKVKKNGLTRIRMKLDCPSVVWGMTKVLKIWLPAIGMYNAIYVRESKGIKCPSVTSDVSFSVDLCIDDSLLKKTF